MAKVEIYTTRICPYCVRAKQLLAQKNVPYVEIDVSDDVGARDHMIQKSGGKRTVPQIFINDVSVGGSDDLHALERAGKLDAMLAQ